MYRVVEQTLFKSFKANNKKLVKIFIVLLIIFQPVFLIIGALPGYLYFSADIFSIYFWTALFVILTASVMSAYIYNVIFQSRYFPWVIQVAGRRHLYTHYCIGQLKFAVPTWLMVGFGYYKSEPSVYSTSMFIILFVAHLAGYFKMANRALYWHQTPTGQPGFIWYIVKHLFSPVVFHLTAYVTLFLLLILILVYVPNLNAKIAFSSILICLLIVMANSISGNMNAVIRRHYLFLTLVDKRACQQVRLVPKLLLSFLWLMPVWLLLNWLI